MDCKIKIGVYDPLGCSEHWEEMLMSKQPLTNLHWKLGPQSVLKSLPPLHLDIVKEVPISIKNINPSTIQEDNDQYFHSVLLETKNTASVPVKIMIVGSDSLDDYRSRIRPLIKEWLKAEVHSKIIKPKWQIVFYIDASTKDRTSIFQKLKTDFGGDVEETVERCIKLKEKYATKQEETESWASFISGLKDMILQHFTFKLQFLEGILQKINLKGNPANPIYPLAFRQLIATTYKDMSLFNDSLASYEILRKNFENLLAKKEFVCENNVEWAQDIDGFFSKYQDLNLIDELLKKTVTKYTFHTSVFLQEFDLYLQLIKLPATLTSSKARLTTEMFKRFKSFMTTILAISSESEELQNYEMVYRLIDIFLSHSEILSLTELAFKHINTDDVQDLSDFPQVIELCGELRLYQRTNFKKLGEAFNYHVADIPLRDVHPTNYKIRSEVLKEFFSSEEYFQNHFIELTELTIQHFIDCNNRRRTADTLTTELAIMAYEKGDYEKTRTIIHDAIYYFKEQGWNFVSGYALKVYIDCLHKTNEKDSLLFLGSYLQLFATNSLAPSQADQCVKEVKKRIDNVPETEYDLTNFCSVSVGTNQIVNTVDTYSIEITLYNTIQSENERLIFDKMSLHLESNDGKKRLVFEIDSVELKNDKILLTSRQIMNDEFVVKKLVCHMGKLKFVKSFSDWFSTSRILLYQQLTTNDLQTKNTILSVDLPTTRELNMERILVNCYTGDQDIQTLVFDFTETEIDQTLEGMKLVHNGEEVSFELLEIAGSLLKPIRLNGTIKKNSHLELFIPHSRVEYDTKVLFNVTCRYESTEGFEFSNSYQKNLNISLSIAVSVQDLFKDRFLYSNFTIGTSTQDKYLIISDTKFYSPDSKTETDATFRITTGYIPDSILASYEQRVSVFYILEPFENCSVQNLCLKVTYRSIELECRKYSKARLTQILTEEKLLNYFFLVESICDDLEFEELTYYNKKIIKSKSVPQWKDQLMTEFQNKDKNLLRAVSHFLDILAHGIYADDHSVVSMELFIDVPMPSIDILHVVDFEPIEQNVEDFRVEEPIQFALKLKTDTRWSDMDFGKQESCSELSNDDKETVDKTTGEETKVELNRNINKKYCFFLEVQDSDTWLISGITTFTYEVDISRGKNITTFDEMRFVLIPLKTGQLLLPKVEIKHGDPGESLRYEVDYKNGSESILVVSASKNATTVSF
ncbi:hypothetical protein LJB42_004459 [Komagataella kurtzmanii]|nr:hypothetical protein LJB42_004459 [Komagataella kurtzmanii]